MKIKQLFTKDVQVTTLLTKISDGTRCVPTTNDQVNPLGYFPPKEALQSPPTANAAANDCELPDVVSILTLTPSVLAVIPGRNTATTEKASTNSKHKTLVPSGEMCTQQPQNKEKKVCTHRMWANAQCTQEDLH